MDFLHKYMAECTVNVESLEEPSFKEFKLDLRNEIKLSAVVDGNERKANQIKTEFDRLLTALWKARDIDVVFKVLGQELNSVLISKNLGKSKY